MMACPICASDKRFLVLGHKGYKIYGCSSCGLEYSDPMKTYLEAYTSREPEKLKFEIFAPPGPNHRKFLHYMPAPRGKLLDVGCGAGNFLYHARKAGYDVYGCDVDQTAVEAVRKTLGIQTVFPLEASEFFREFPGLKFDVITFFEVLEHLEDPWNF